SRWNCFNGRRAVGGGVGIGSIVHDGSVVVWAEVGLVADATVEIPCATLGDVLIQHFHEPVPIMARLLVPKPYCMSNFMHQRAGLAFVVDANLLLAADHSNRRKAEPLVVLPCEPDIIFLVCSRNQTDRREFSPVVDRVVDSLRAWDIAIDYVGNHPARPSVAIRDSGIRRPNLIERRQAK